MRDVSMHDTHVSILHLATSLIDDFWTLLCLLIDSQKCSGSPPNKAEGQHFKQDFPTLAQRPKSGRFGLNLKYFMIRQFIVTMLSTQAPNHDNAPTPH